MTNIPPPPTDDQSKGLSVKSRLSFALDGYDSVVGITENAVNSTLASVWPEESTVTMQLMRGDEETDETYVAAEVKGKVLAPTVEFLVDDFKGIFYLHFGDDAVFQLLVISGGRPILKPYEIHNWTLAWEVDFSRREIDNLPEAQRRLVQNLQDYTPHHVFINFSNANLLHPNEQKSNTPLPASLDASKEPDERKKKIIEKRMKEIQDTLPLLTSDWIRQQVQAGKNIFGYDITATNNNTSVVSSLQATDLSMQTYPYWSRGKVDSDGSTLYHPYSCFLFANQFAYRDLPKNNAGSVRPIAYSGNLVTPFKIDDKRDESQMAGTLVIRKERFIDHLTDVLKDISDDMFLGAESVTFKSESVIRNCKQDFQVKRGTRRHLIDFQESQSGGDPITVKWSQPEYSEKKEGYDGKGHNNVLAANEGNLTTRGANEITVTGGDNFLRVKGWSSYKFTWHTRIAAHWWNQGGWPWVECGWDWDYKICLGVTSEGTIQLSVPEADFQVTTRNLQLIGTVGYYMNDIKSIKGLDSPVTAANAKKALEPINAALKTAGLFVLPAAGQYNFYDPVFNSAADLMVPFKLEATEIRIN